MFKELIFKENCVVHCPEMWMAKRLLEYAHSKGYDWYFDRSYLIDNSWGIYGKDTCYYIHNGSFGDFDIYQNYHIILKFEDVYLGKLRRTKDIDILEKHGVEIPEDTKVVSTYGEQYKWELEEPMEY